MLKQFINKLTSYLEFSTFERRGVFFLLFILLLISGYYYYKNTKVVDVVRVDKEKLEILRSNMDKAFENKSNKAFDSKFRKSVFEESTKSTKIISSFNPNKDDIATMVNHGLPLKVAKNIVNYRNSGGKFRKVQDLNKLFTIDSLLFDKLKDHAIIDFDLNTNEEIRKDIDLEKQKTIIEINQASQEELQTIPGIGPAYAKWIAEYRQKLGGFNSLKQLLEVYKFDQEKYDQVSPYITLNEENLQRININSATKKELAKHPYITYQQAIAIIAFKEQHGKYSSAKDISKIILFTKKDLNRILPYLDVN